MKRAARMAFTESLLRLARANPEIIAVATDSRGSVTLTDFAAELPQEFVECGIAEQNAIGVSAGLANVGLRPFVCGPACFYSLRAAEQIKVDVAYSGMNVKIIGVSGGVSYGPLGATHHATQDIALMRAIPGLEVFLPADAAQMEDMAAYLAVSDRPAYVRMGRGAVEDVYSDFASSFTAGQANVLRPGQDMAIIACGEMVSPSLKAARLLAADGLSVRVLDMHTIKPLDEGAILRAAETGLVVTVEEHSVHGGLGAAVAEVLCQKRPTPMLLLGLPDETLFTGTSAQIFAHYGLTPQGIAQRILEKRRTLE